MEKSKSSHVVRCSTKVVFGRKFVAVPPGSSILLESAIHCELHSNICIFALGSKQLQIKHRIRQWSIVLTWTHPPFQTDRGQHNTQIPASSCQLVSSHSKYCTISTACLPPAVPKFSLFLPRTAARATSSSSSNTSTYERTV